MSRAKIASGEKLVRTEVDKGGGSIDGVDLRQRKNRKSKFDQLLCTVRERRKRS